MTLKRPEGINNMTPEEKAMEKALTEQAEKYRELINTKVDVLLRAIKRKDKIP